MKRAIVIGASGYTGAELVGLLLGHPGVELAALYGSGRGGGGGESPPAFAELFPRWRGLCDLPVGPIKHDDVVVLEPDVVFLATPHEASHDLVPDLLDAGIVVIDLSAAFRLADAALYPRHYGFTHARPDLLQRTVYGLPEIHRDALRSADLIAAPGCYPTSAILALHPLVSAGAIAPSWRPIIDATSGVSGAGRTPVLKSHFCEVSLQPYGVFSHRHGPEIAAHAGTPVVFTPHLGAFERGILSTIHVQLGRGWSGPRVEQVYRAAYGEEPFVRLLGSASWPAVAAVRGTNFCDLGWAVDEEQHHLIVVSAIDNLVKGAAGQAVQCMNIRLGLPETMALLKEVQCQPQHT